MKKINIIIERFDKKKKYLASYKIPFKEKMRVLDVLLNIQKEQDGTLAVRWNCREGICGSCGIEVNGKPVLACKEEIKKNLNNLNIKPMKVFPVVKDLVVNVESVYEKSYPLLPYYTGKSKQDFLKMHENEVADAMEMRKCINCFLCHDVCHTVRNHPELKFPGPRNLVKAASMEFHPKNNVDRSKSLEKEGIFNCNVNRCCEEICPQDIKVTQNAIINLKEKVAGKHDLIELYFYKLLKRK